MDGFLLINKKKDWTSRDVCNKVARILKTKKVGHNGTLDPFATGLMLVALGKATKALPYVEFNYKTYISFSYCSSVFIYCFCDYFNWIIFSRVYSK